MQNLTILLYVPDVKDKKLPKRIADAIRIVSQYAGIQLLVTVQPQLVPSLNVAWIGVGRSLNDRTGEQATYANVDPAWFTATFPNTVAADLVAACISRDDWYRARPEPDFYQIGRSVDTPGADLVFTDPKGVPYDLGGGEVVDPWTWALLHELSHNFFINFMGAPDPTHPLDYQAHNLLGAVKQWKLGKGWFSTRLLELYNALLALLIKQKETMDTSAPVPPTPAIDPLDKLIHALIRKESGDAKHPDGFDGAVGDLGLAQKAYGPLQIRQPVCIDVNRTYGTTHNAQEMLNNRAVSIDVCKKYLAIYATRARLGFEPTDEARARIWNGGPAGWKKAATEGYWRDVKKLLAAL